MLILWAALGALFVYIVISIAAAQMTDGAISVSWPWHVRRLWRGDD